MEQNLDTMIDESVLGSALESIWLNVLGAHPERAPIDHLLVPEESYFAGVSITGVWNGACVFSCSEALARRITALMFGSDPDDVTADDLRDALGEMANLLGGQVKALVPEGSDISRWDGATQAWVVEEIIDISGTTENCAWDVSAGGCA